MVKRHLSRLAAPISWPIKRKGMKFITKSNPGPHNLKNGVPINILIKNLLKYSKTSKESKVILNNGGIVIDKIVRKDYKFPVGFFDIVEIPKLKEKYTLIFDKRGKLCLRKIKGDNKIIKIIGKTKIKSGKTQLNFYDGRNILVEKDDYRVGDSIILDLENNKILKHLKMDKGSLIFVIGGKYIGEELSVDKIEKDKIFCKNKIEIPKKYTFVIEKGFFEK